MIKDEELKLKITENPEESLWEKVRQGTESRIKSMEESLIVEREVLGIAEYKLKKFKQ